MSVLPISKNPPSTYLDLITPDDQLKKIIETVVRERIKAATKSDLEGICEVRKMNVDWDEIIQIGVDIIFNKLTGSAEENEVLPLTILAAKKWECFAPIRTCLTDWYTARKISNLLPEYMPPFPDNIVEITESACPIHKERKVWETHILQLLCKEDGNLKQFEAKVKAFGADPYAFKENPLQFRTFESGHRQKFEAIPFEDTHLILCLKDVLSGSRAQSPATQSLMAWALSVRAKVPYELPSIYDIPRVLFLHKIATNETLLSLGSTAANNGLFTLTRVREILDNWPFAVGSFDSSGMSVCHIRYDHVCVGVVAVRKFY